MSSKTRFSIGLASVLTFFAILVSVLPQPVYSFHADIPLPPKLAVLSLKRMWSGEMTNARLVAELEAARPEIMVLRNTTLPSPYHDFLQRNYRMIYEDADVRLYATPSVIRQSQQR